MSASVRLLGLKASVDKGFLPTFWRLNFECFIKAVRIEGSCGLYKDFLPTFLKLTPTI